MNEVDFTIQEDLTLFLLVLSDEGGLGDCFLIVWEASSLELVHLVLLLVSSTLNFAIELAVEDHLVPSVILLEASDDIIIVIVLSWWWIHESSILEAIVFKLSFILFTDVKCFQYFIIFKLKTGLHSSILDKTQNLKIKLWVFYDATISTNLFILNVSFANITSILNLNKVNVNDKSAYLNHMPDNLVEGNLLKQHDSIISFKIIHFINNSSNHLKICLIQLNLRINIKIIRNLSIRISDEHNMPLQDECLQVNIRWMLDEECYPGLIINWFQINLGGDDTVRVIVSIIIIILLKLTSFLILIFPILFV